MGNGGAGGGKEAGGRPGRRGGPLDHQGTGGMALGRGVGRQGGMGAGPVATVEQKRKKNCENPPGLN